MPRKHRKKLLPLYKVVFRDSKGRPADHSTGLTSPCKNCGQPYGCHRANDDCCPLLKDGRRSGYYMGEEPANDYAI